MIWNRFKDFARNERSQPYVGALVLFLLISISLAFIAHNNARRIGTDSAANLLVAQNVTTLGQYVSEDRFSFGVGEPFDPTITTGPTVILPIAFMNHVVGSLLVSGRTVMALFWLALMLTIYLSLRSTLGRFKAASVALLPQTINFTGMFEYAELQGPVDVVGEIPALFFTFLAIALLPRHAFGSGVALGLAVLTKLSFLLVFPAFFLGLLILNYARLWKRSRRAVLGFFTGVIVPGASWEGYKLISSGPEQYLAQQVSVIRFLESANVHTGFGPPTGVEEVGGLLPSVVSLSFLPVPIALFVTLSIVAIALVAFVLDSRKRGLKSSLVNRLGLVIYVSSGLTFLLWWLFLNDAHYSRTLVPGLVFLTVGFFSLALDADLALRKFRGPFLTTVSVSPIVVGIMASYATPITDSLESQWQVNNLIREHSPASVSYFQQNRLLVNDILVLGGVTVNNEPGQDLHLISHPEEWLIPDQVTRQQIEDQCHSILLTTTRHTVCKPKLAHPKS